MAIYPTENSDLKSENKTLSTIEDNERHAAVAFKKMNYFRRQNQLCDIIVKVEDKEFPAHRVVLAASSDYFDAMFSSGMAESAQSIVELKSITSDVMEALLEFVYTGQVKVDMENVQDLLPAASLVQMEGVKSACSTFLYEELDSTNVLGIRRFAELHNCSDLECYAKNFAAHNFESVIENEEFIFLGHEELCELIAREDLYIDSEESVYKAVIRWVYHAKNDRVQYLSTLLRTIRLSVLSVRFLTDVVDMESLIRDSFECRDLVDDAKRYHLRPDLRHMMSEKRYRQRDGADEYLVVIGGFASDQNPSDSVEMLNPRTREWTELPSLPIRYRYVAACSLGTCVYVIGGFDGRERLDTVGVLDIAQRDGWRWVASMQFKRGLSAACTHKGLIYVCGGFDGQTRLRSLEVYHSRIDEWRLLDEMLTPREGAGLVVADEHLYCLGGYDGYHLLNSMECYDIDVGTWSMCKPMYMRRSGAGCAVLGDTIYVCGGYGGAEGRAALHLDTAEAYNTRMGQWTLISSMNVPRCYVGACSLAGRVYVAAGYDGNRLLSTVESYDPIEKTWRLVEESMMHHERCDTGMCVVRFLPCANFGVFSTPGNQQSTSLQIDHTSANPIASGLTGAPISNRVDGLRRRIRQPIIVNPYYAQQIVIPTFNNATTRPSETRRPFLRRYPLFSMNRDISHQREVSSHELVFPGDLSNNQLPPPPLDILRYRTSRVILDLTTVQNVPRQYDDYEIDENSNLMGNPQVIDDAQDYDDQVEDESDVNDSIPEELAVVEEDEDDNEEDLRSNPVPANDPPLQMGSSLNDSQFEPEFPNLYEMLSKVTLNTPNDNVLLRSVYRPLSNCSNNYKGTALSGPPPDLLAATSSSHSENGEPSGLFGFANSRRCSLPQIASLDQFDSAVDSLNPSILNTYLTDDDGLGNESSERAVLGSASGDIRPSALSTRMVLPLNNRYSPCVPVLGADEVEHILGPSNNSILFSRRPSRDNLTTVSPTLSHLNPRSVSTSVTNASVTWSSRSTHTEINNPAQIEQNRLETTMNFSNTEVNEPRSDGEGEEGEEYYFPAGSTEESIPSARPLRSQGHSPRRLGIVGPEQYQSPNRSNTPVDDSGMAPPGSMQPSVLLDISQDSTFE